GDRPITKPRGERSLKVLNDRPSKRNDMPIGVYQIPDTSVYVSGHQGAAGVGMLFGIIGVAAAHAAAQSTAERKTQDVTNQLKVDLRSLAEQVVVDELARRGGSGSVA